MSLLTWDNSKSRDRTGASSPAAMQQERGFVAAAHDACRRAVDRRRADLDDAVQPGAHPADPGILGQRRGDPRHDHGLSVRLCRGAIDLRAALRPLWPTACRARLPGALRARVADRRGSQFGADARRRAGHPRGRRMRRHGAVARHGRRSLCRQWGGADHLADEPHSEHRACRCTGAGRHADHGAELALAVRTDGPLRDVSLGLVWFFPETNARRDPGATRPAAIV